MNYDNQIVDNNAQDPWDFWTSEYERSKYLHQVQFLKIFVNPTSILEIGSAAGSHTKILMDSFPQADVECVEVDSRYVNTAAQKLRSYSQLKITNSSIVDYAEKLPPNHFDVIIFSEVFDNLYADFNLDDFTATIEFLQKALLPTGVMCISHIVHRPYKRFGVRHIPTNYEMMTNLVADYFKEVASSMSVDYKEEIGKSFQYKTHIYKPRSVLQNSRQYFIPADTVQPKISAIIPAYNEEKNVGYVVSELVDQEFIDEVIVVDNNSSDDTAKIARSEGAKIVHCPLKGYGRAVKAGIRAAENNWIFKIDADIEYVEDDLVARLIEDANIHKSALVKTYWQPTEKDPLPVTLHTVRPALKIFFPQLVDFQTPLSGLYLFDRDKFNIGQLPNTFALDIAMLVQCVRSRLGYTQIPIEDVKHANVKDGSRSNEHHYKMSEELLEFLVAAGYDEF